MKKSLLLCATLAFLALLFALSVAGCDSADDDDDNDAGETDDDDNDDDNDASPPADDDDDNDDQPALQVGAARVDITPEDSVLLGGFGSCFLAAAFCRWSEGVHDPIYATAIALDDGNVPPIVVINLDIVGLIITDGIAIRQQLGAALGIGSERIVVTSTHNHQSPDTIGLWGVIIPPQTGRDDDFIAAMIAGAVQAGREAYDNRVPVYAFAAQGLETELHYNVEQQDDPEAPLDSHLTVLQFIDEAGDSVATLGSWGAHATAMGPHNSLLSADFPGAYYKYMDQALGGVNMFVNGVLGGGVLLVNNPDPNSGLFEDWGTWAEVDRIGEVLADRARELLAGAEELDDPAVNIITTVVETKLQNIAFAGIGLLNLIPRDIPPLGGNGVSQLSAWRLGPVVFASMPGEVTPRIGLALREMIGGDYQIIANVAQDWIGYIMAEEEYRDLNYIYYAMLAVGPDTGRDVLAVYQKILPELSPAAF